MKNEVIQNIQRLRDSKTPCAQATLLGVFRGLEKFYPQEDILRAAASGLRGGIGRIYNQGSCGAYTVPLSKPLTVFAKGENLTATKYQINYGFPMPRATVMAGLEWNF